MEPNEARARMAKLVTADLNAAIASGQIKGVEPIVIAPEPTAAAPTAPVVAPVPPAPTPTVEAAPASAPAPEGKIWDKYSNMEEAKKGYFNAVNTLSSVLDESAQKDAEIARLRSQVAAPRVDQERERVNPVSRNPMDWTKDPAVMKASELSGIPSEVFAEFAQSIETRAAQQAKQTFDDTLSPLKAVAEAESYMRETYPDALNHTKEVENFIKSNPRVASTVGALIKANDPKAAMEYAWTNYTIATGIGIQTEMKANAEVAEAERAKARAAANLPASPSTPVSAAAQGPPTPTREEIEFLKERAAAGDEKAAVVLRRALLGPMLPPALRTWEQG